MINRDLMQVISNKRKFLLFSAASGGISASAAFFQAFFIALPLEAVFIKKQSLADIFPYLLGLFVVFATKAVIGYFLDQRIIAWSQQSKNALRYQVMENILHKGPQTVRKEGTGAFLAAMTEGAEKIEAYFIEYVPAAFQVVLTSILLLTAVGYLDLLSFFILVFTLPLLPFFMGLIGKEAGRQNEKYFHELKKMGAYFLDFLRGMTEIKLFSNVEKRIEAVKKVTEQFRTTTMKILRVSFLSALVLELAGTISTAIVAVSLGLRLLYGHMAFFEAFFILLLTPEIFQPLKNYGAKFHVSMSAIAAFRGISPYLVLDNTAKVTDSQDSKTTPQILKHWHAALEKGRAESGGASLSLRNICFSYVKGAAPTLRDINLDILPGKITLLTGPSGAGKSTLLHLLLGLLPDFDGEILLNGNPIIKSELYRLRHVLSVMPQHTFIFHNSFLKNIDLCDLNPAEEQINGILQDASIDFCQAWPDGIHTVLDEDGASISTGQAQRIAIARALLRNLPFLILDEPTEALDDVNEQIILETLMKLKQENKGICIISHKDAFLSICDLHYHMEAGALFRKEV